jgi:hypothetical protein
MTFPILKSGMAARYDGLRGMLPCKVLSITGASGRPSTGQRCVIQFTRDAAGWRRGDTFECFALHVVPPVCVRRRKYSSDWIAPYTVQADAVAA